MQDGVDVGLNCDSQDNVVDDVFKEDVITKP